MIRSTGRPQHGFTLMELIVVVVVISILLSLALMSMKPNEAAQLRQQTANLKGLIISVCDQSAFEQKIYLLTPNSNGLVVETFEDGKWQPSDKWKDLNWHESVEVDWTFDRKFAVFDQKAAQGWMCWPSGEVTAGKITVTLDKFQRTLQWNTMMQFEVIKEQL